METMKPALKRGRDVWDRISMPRAEFQERVARMRAQMEKRAMDVLLFYGNNADDYGDPCYVSNYVMKTPQGAVAVIPRAGEVSLICEGFARDLPGVKAITWVEDVRSCDNVSKGTIAFLKEKALLPATIGMAGMERSMPHEQFRFFLESTGSCTLVNADGMMREMRMIKSPREADQVARAGRIISRALEGLGATAFFEPREKSIEAVVGWEAFLEGAEDVRVLITGPGEERGVMRPCEARSLPMGEPMVLFLAVEFERYWSEALRTFVFKGNALVEDEGGFLGPLFERIVEGLVAGKEISRFCAEAAARAEELGLSLLSGYGLGQGIGLSPEEAPLLGEEEEGRLQEGMCLSLHAAARNREGKWAVRGETIHLAESGPEVLTGP